MRRSSMLDEAIRRRGEGASAQPASAEPGRVASGRSSATAGHGAAPPAVVVARRRAVAANTRLCSPVSSKIAASRSAPIPPRSLRPAALTRQNALSPVRTKRGKRGKARLFVSLILLQSAWAFGGFADAVERATLGAFQPSVSPAPETRSNAGS